MNLQEETAFLGFERSMIGARRAARIGKGRKTLAAIALVIIADCEIA
jgi:hypothetical protein